MPTSHIYGGIADGLQKGIMLGISLRQQKMAEAKQANDQQLQDQAMELQKLEHENTQRSQKRSYALDLWDKIKDPVAKARFWNARIKDDETGIPSMPDDMNEQLLSMGKRMKEYYKAVDPKDPKTYATADQLFFGDLTENLPLLNQYDKAADTLIKAKPEMPGAKGGGAQSTFAQKLAAYQAGTLTEKEFLTSVQAIPQYSVEEKATISSNAGLAGAGEDAWKKDREDAVAAQKMKMSIAAGRAEVDKGIYTGAGANIAQDFDRWLQTAGIELNGQTVSNTQTYASVMGNVVGQIIRAFGSGTGLSDADREYATKIAGGQITLTEEAIRKLLDINDRIADWTIKNYQERTNHLGEGQLKESLKLPGAALGPKNPSASGSGAGPATTGGSTQSFTYDPSTGTLK